MTIMISNHENQYLILKMSRQTYLLFFTKKLYFSPFRSLEETEFDISGSK